MEPGIHVRSIWISVWGWNRILVGMREHDYQITIKQIVEYCKVVIYRKRINWIWLLIHLWFIDVKVGITSLCQLDGTRVNFDGPDSGLLRTCVKRTENNFKQVEEDFYYHWISNDNFFKQSRFSTDTWKNICFLL